MPLISEAEIDREQNAARYFDDFTDWADVARNFNIERAEPEEIIVASYQTGNYEGDAFVCYREGDRFFTVEGSHCSCFGLEGQWEPEGYDAATLLAAFERSKGWGSKASCAQTVMIRLRDYLASKES